MHSQNESTLPGLDKLESSQEV